MAWFTGGSTGVNEKCTIKEGDNREWVITLSQTTNVSLRVELTDGSAPDILFIPDNEYNNFVNGLLYKVIGVLSFPNAMRFYNEASLRMGKYHLIVNLPVQQDGCMDYSTFAIRYEPLV